MLSVTGPVAPLLRAAADLDPVDLTARRADLDELFLTYYRTGTDASRRMSADIARLDLRLRRRSLIGYALGMAVYALIVVALYPSFKDDTSLNKLTENGNTVAALFGATGSLTTPVRLAEREPVRQLRPAGRAAAGDRLRRAEHRRAGRGRHARPARHAAAVAAAASSPRSSPPCACSRSRSHW